MHEIIMPKLGLSMEKGVIIQWLKNPGDKVEKGEPLLEVEADKANLEVEAYHSGYLIGILKEAGEELPINTIVGYIGNKDEKIPEQPVTAGTQGAVPEVNLSKAPIGNPVNPEKKDKDRDASPATAERKKISPLARKMAAEFGLDITSEGITGSGHGGRIRKADILAYIQKNNKPDAGGDPTILSTTPIRGMRKIIADRMVESKTSIPHFVLNTTVEVTDLMTLRSEINESLQKNRGIKITFTDLILKVCSIALTEIREINSALIGDEHRIYESVNIGLAVSIDSGLVVPTVRNCQASSLLQISQERVRLIEKSRNNRLEPDDMAGGTFTVTNLGMYNVRSFSAIINPPQAAILAVGKIYETPVIRKGILASGNCLNLALSVDHRIVDGAVAARFIDRLTELLENPGLLAAY